MPYIKILLVVKDTEVIKSYDPPAINHYVREFLANEDSPKDAWYAIYCYKDGTARWIADCGSLMIARQCAKGLANYYGYIVEEDFPADYKIEDIERPLYVQ